jgi:hypothetical protein
MFTIDEVVAALLPNVGRSREVELRVDADGYVVVDIVAPVQALQSTHLEPTADGVREVRPHTKEEDDFPGDRPSQVDSDTSQPSDPAGTELGPREEEARSLCSLPLFRAFLEVKTEEAALKIMAERCHVRSLADLDRTRSNGMNLRHVIEEYEAWKIT